MPFTGGYVKLHRSLLAWEWHDSPETLTVFVHLLLMASFSESTYHGLKIEPGQVITGRKALARTTGLSEQQIRTALNRLKSTNSITIKSTSKYSVVSIVNFRFFQGLDYESNQQSDQRATSNQPTVNQQSTTLEEGKEGKESNYIVASTPRKRFAPPTVDEVAAYCHERGNSVDAQRFHDYYEANGWKVGKNPMKNWKAAVRTWEKRDCQNTQGGNPYAGLREF